MPDAGGPHEFVYVHTDIPEGMTIREWRLQRTVERQRLRAQERATRRARRRAPVDAMLACFKRARFSDGRTATADNAGR